MSKEPRKVGPCRRCDGGGVWAVVSTLWTELIRQRCDMCGATDYVAVAEIAAGTS